MSFPYVLYYRLQSCMTNNIYEIPASTSSKTILASGGGTSGWLDASSAWDMRSVLGNIPVIGKIADMILGNIGINYMPWWNASSGTKTKEP